MDVMAGRPVILKGGLAREGVWDKTPQDVAAQEGGGAYVQF